MSTDQIILASGSASRRILLANAGISAHAIKPNVDETAAKARFRAEDVPVGDQAMALAEMKALKISNMYNGLVIGGDQMLSLHGKPFDKPGNFKAAREQLQCLSGETHYLETALVVAESGQIVWRHISKPALTMRPLSEAFIAHYLQLAGTAIFDTVGGYQLEGPGSQLFSQISGDYFSILGLPLLPLMAYLRERGHLEA